MAWLDCRLKEGPRQCTDNTWCWTGTVCWTARRSYLSHYSISVTVPLNYVWLYRCKLHKERHPELWQIPPETPLSRIISSTNFNAQFNNNMYVTLLSSACFGPWHAHPQEEQLQKHSIWYPRSGIKWAILYVCHITILDMFRALTCPSSGGTTAKTQHLVSSLS